VGKSRRWKKAKKALWNHTKTLAEHFHAGHTILQISLMNNLFKFSKYRYKMLTFSVDPHQSYFLAKPLFLDHSWYLHGDETLNLMKHEFLNSLTEVWYGGYRFWESFQPKSKLFIICKEGENLIPDSWKFYNQYGNDRKQQRTLPNHKR
jgi:hypothetical protein